MIKKLLVDNRVWIKKTVWWAAFCFLLGTMIFLVWPAGAQEFLGYLSSTYEEILGEEKIMLGFDTVWAIFLNNLQAGLIILFGGAILGVVPLLALGVNFFILGYILAFLAVEQGISGITAFVIGVVPHGLVELPFLVLAAAFGLRLGWFWRLPGGQSAWKKLWLALKDNLKLVPIIVAGFLLAAIIEVFVSGALLEKLSG